MDERIFENNNVIIRNVTFRLISNKIVCPQDLLLVCFEVEKKRKRESINWLQMSHLFNRKIWNAHLYRNWTIFWLTTTESTEKIHNSTTIIHLNKIGINLSFVSQTSSSILSPSTRPSLFNSNIRLKNFSMIH